METRYLCTKGTGDSVGELVKKSRVGAVIQSLSMFLSSFAHGFLLFESLFLGLLL